MGQIDDLLSQISKKRDTFSLYGPCSSDAIEELEKALEVRLPDSYRNFLAKYGGGGPSPGISGIYGDSAKTLNWGTVYGDTIRTRQDFGIPADIVVIYRDESGAIWGLHTSELASDGECPVVCVADGIIENSHRTFSEFLEEYLRLRA